MRDLNIDFLELYKDVDKFIREAYSSADGVTEYIRNMEQYSLKGPRYVNTWRKDYDMLQRVKRIRNQLAHDVRFDSDICEENDYDWLYNFHRRLFSAEDPLAMMIKQEKAERQRLVVEEKQRQADIRIHQQTQQQTQQQSQQGPTNQASASQRSEKTPSFWKRIRRFFLGS